ncbi:AraC family transcriptional regulator [Duganella sp. FT3S]|uniref:AraC family transcriptional regulator n=1 Tax=Rugamonas fusca TaxID=2758568 RepID=A0A7W2EJC5_9BURK|nr:AraC family transcriptional regulator [Rugamonas fusca]MBA5607012.1 AraC family transcriptional regulator [Rugamonas fusca]
MKPNELSIPARYFTQLLDHLESQGMPCRDVLSAAQIRTLNDRHARLTLPQVRALLTEAARLSGRQDLGFELGRLIKLNSHDVLGYAFLSAPTIDHLLRLAARYYRLMVPLFTMRYIRHATSAEVLFQPVANLPPDVFAFYTDMITVSCHGQFAVLTQGRQPVYDIFLSAPAPPYLARYRELRGVRVHFGDGGQRGIRLVFDACLLDQPLPMADLRALRQAEERCKQMMDEFTVHGNWRDWVEMMLRGAEDSQPKLDELAAVLNVSTRTLDRHLARQGVNFRTLAVQIRNERACELLAGGKSSISQIAYRLGYTDVANFSRSFRKVNGVSPGSYRAGQGGGDAA